MVSTMELLQLTAAVYKRNFGLYFGYAAWILIPQAALVFLSATAPDDLLVAQVAISVLVTVLAIWVGIVMTKITAGILMRKKLDLDLISRASLPLVVSVFWVALLTGVVQIIGFLLLIVPGVLFSIWYAFAEMEVILEDKRGIAAMASSREITRGKFWAIFVRLLVGTLVLLGVYLAVSSGLTALLELLTTGAVTFMDAAPSVAALTIQSIIDTFFMAPFIIFTTMLYLDVKAEHTGTKKPKKV